MRFVFPVLAGLLASGVQSYDVDQKEITPLEGVARAREYFTASLLDALDKRADQKNVVVSTFGLHSAFTSLMAGAKGRTFDQLWEKLG